MRIILLIVLFVAFPVFSGRFQLEALSARKMLYFSFAPIVRGPWLPKKSKKYRQRMLPQKVPP